MIERKDVLSIPYLKKTTFTGSYEGLRFRFAVLKKEVPSADPKGQEGEVPPADPKGRGKEVQVLEVTAWEAPYGFDATLEEKKQRMETEFSEEGIQGGIDWLNGLWAREPERWLAAKANW